MVLPTCSAALVRDRSGSPGHQPSTTSVRLFVAYCCGRDQALRVLASEVCGTHHGGSRKRRGRRRSRIPRATQRGSACNVAEFRVQRSRIPRAAQQDSACHAAEFRVPRSRVVSRIA